MEDSIQQILKQRFGFDTFRGAQQAIIEGVLQGKSALVVMPTGRGKSLCYQLPSQILPGLTLVISPLIALMKDQVDAAQKKGINCCFINSSLSRDERIDRYQRLSRQEYDLVYVTPERFRKPEFIEALKTNDVSLLAVDEAHCISQWGHDFRPDYTRVGDIREIVEAKVTLALTATATPEVQTDILKQLRLDPDATDVYLDGIERPNLHIKVDEVVGIDEKVQRTVAYHHHHPGATIVYFALISTLEKYSYMLRQVGIKHLVYHGQLPDHQRRRAQEKFLKGDGPLILATPAFGLGVDKPNVRMVIHAETPGSVEAYYQEIGRAGRDGEDSHCIFLYDADDVSIQMDFIKWANPDAAFIEQVYYLIADNKDRVFMQGLDFVREQLNFYNRRDFRVETAVNLLERWECLERGERNRNEFRILENPPEEYLQALRHSDRLKQQNEKLLDVVNLAREESCRMQYVYGYFGVDSTSPCGHCDNCGGFE